MKRLIAFLITGYWDEPKDHEHEWETFAVVPIHEIPDNGSMRQTGFAYHLRCKTCGDIKCVNCNVNCST